MSSSFKEIAQTAKTDTQQLQQEFWSVFREYLLAGPYNLASHQSPAPNLDVTAVGNYSMRFNLDHSTELARSFWPDIWIVGESL